MEDYLNDSTIINHHILTQHREATSLHSIHQPMNSHLQRSTQKLHGPAEAVGTILCVESRHGHHQEMIFQESTSAAKKTRFGNVTNYEQIASHKAKDMIIYDYENGAHAEENIKKYMG